MYEFANEVSRITSGVLYVKPWQDNGCTALATCVDDVRESIDALECQGYTVTQMDDFFPVRLLIVKG